MGHTQAREFGASEPADLVVFVGCTVCDLTAPSRDSPCRHLEIVFQAQHSEGVSRWKIN